MRKFEYKVLPAPTRGKKGRAVKGPGARFAHALEHAMNELGAEGWEYVRADTLPAEERAGLTGKTTNYYNMLVFRREIVVVPDDAKAAIAAPQSDDAEKEATNIEDPDLTVTAPVEEPTITADDDTQVPQAFAPRG